MSDVDFYLGLYHMGQLLAAYIFALPIGWNREKSAQSAGLRTFPLVAVGACAFMIFGMTLGDTEAKARVVYGIITGIGFIGGGAILKDGGSVQGTATAASIWNTGALGVAVAFSRWDIAAALCVFNIVTFQYVYRFKSHAKEEEQERGWDDKKDISKRDIRDDNQQHDNPGNPDQT